jgi:hypothetical protein
VTQFQRTLELDSENIDAHYNLMQIYDVLGDRKQAEEHRALHARYKSDDNAGDKAIAIAREKYPAANRAAEAVVLYPLQRAGAPELPQQAALQPEGKPVAVTSAAEKPENPSSGGGK